MASTDADTFNESDASYGNRAEYSKIPIHDTVTPMDNNPMVDVEKNAATENYYAISNQILKKSVRNLGEPGKLSKSDSEMIIDNAPVVLSFKDLSISTIKEPVKTLLSSFSGSITGGFWAIMGGSGAGKSILLSSLSLRLDRRKLNITGEMRINGRTFDNGVLKAMSAYVIQDDLMFAELTVHETVSYAASLRLFAFDQKFREDRVTFVLELMQISHRKDVIIGDTRNKGISGGERKRVAIAIELLTQPRLLFLDKPTSGLDSSTALAVCDALKELTSKGYCTVLCTIHQPQKSIFEFFDNLILIKRGKVVYMGKAGKAVPFIETLTGASCADDVNPADFLITSIYSASDETLTQSRDSVAKKLVNLDLGQDKETFVRQELTVTNWTRQFTILFHRSMLQYSRRTTAILMNFISVVVMSIFISCGVWYQIGNDQTSISKRRPSLFFNCVSQGTLAAFQTIATFPVERAVILRERAAGSYFASSYFWSKTSADIITSSWGSILFTCIVYFTIGYQNTARKFFTFLILMLLDTWSALSLATMVSCLCVTLEASTVVLSLLLEISRLYSAFYVAPIQLDMYEEWRFADAMSYLKYTFVGVSLNELHGLELDCVTSTGAIVPASSCITTGGQIINQFAYDQYTIAECVGILFVYVFITRFIGYVALRFLK